MPNIAVISQDANHNLLTLLEAHQEKNLKDGELTLVATRAESSLRHARKAGVETLEITADGAYNAELADQIAVHKPDLIVVLDSPHNFDAAFLKKFPNKVIAVHPALAGQFPDADAVERAFKAFHDKEIKWSGCHVHYVGPAGTAAKVMRQLVVPIEPKDTLERFAARMRKGEKWLLLKAVKQFLYELRNQNKRSRSPVSS
ncbi:MAG TPA: formyltransferase family protein [Spirillospora sp.]|nr:formyltransferase family protein [Spirillospora sp.]